MDGKPAGDMIVFPDEKTEVRLIEFLYEIFKKIIDFVFYWSSCFSLGVKIIFQVSGPGFETGNYI